MATIYKMSDRPNWMISWFDGTGTRKTRSSGTTDKKAADALAAKLERDAMLRREGVVDPRADGFAEGAKRPLLEHVEKFAEYLRDKGDTERHALDREQQLRALIERMKVSRVAHLTPARVQGALADLRKERDLALRTLSRYLVAAKALTRWLVREGLLQSDPLAGLSRFNAETDRRLVRRALTHEEATALIAAAERGGRAVGLSGRDRAALYRIALGTGFRASEIGSLTPESFDLDGDMPTITVKAGYSKNRTEAVQPIRADLAHALRPWLSEKARGERVFAVRELRYSAARMVRKDLAIAGIAVKDEDGSVIDFHALRHSYITEVVRAGASVKEAQTLARHKTPDLTFRVYAHARLHDLTRTLERMPPVESDTIGTATTVGAYNLSWPIAELF